MLVRRPYTVTLNCGVDIFMATPEILLTEDQRMEITQIPSNINEYEIAKYYTFSVYDISIINKHRRDYNRLGFAVQLALLRNPGCSLSFITNCAPSHFLTLLVAVAIFSLSATASCVNWSWRYCVPASPTGKWVWMCMG